MAAKRLRLCVVAPCYNEQEVLPLFHAELRRVCDTELTEFDVRMLYVDDGSCDDTLGVLNSLAASDDRVRVFSLSRNFGHQIALTAGLDLARGDAIVVMDSDLQHPPTLIPQFIREWRAGNDVVSAVRQHSDDATWIKRITSDGFYTIFNGLSDTKLIPSAADFCLLSQRAHRALRRMREQHRFLRGMISWMGFRRSCVKFTAPARAAGKSKYTIRKMLRFASDALASFAFRPLRIAARIGFVATMASFVGIGASLFQMLRHGNALGLAALSSIWFLLGALLLSVGLLGDTAVRIYEESKRRPLYFFKQRPNNAQQQLTIFDSEQRTTKRPREAA